uniref:26S proteasome non-ATPase regulatory subunit 2 n=1 Tax=Macrostomum lignano TaxID=282301 RepID=A0A1I8JGQ7_9PLAT
SEEDAQLKDELNMLVERLQESDSNLYKPALESLRNLIRSSTTSMISAPKPLKFLRPHYESLRNEVYVKIPDGPTKRLCADIVSVLAMTAVDKPEFRTDSLRYRFLGSGEDIGAWGHEYVRHLTGQCVLEWEAMAEAEQQQMLRQRRLERRQQRQQSGADSKKDNDDNDEDNDESGDEDGEEPMEEDGPAAGGVRITRDQLLSLCELIIPYHMSHNAESEAIDLCVETGQLAMLEKHTGQANYQRVCLYLTSCVPYLPDEDWTAVLDTARRIYLKFGDQGNAMRCALKLNSPELVSKQFAETPDPTVRKQLACLLGRQQFAVDWDEDAYDDAELLSELMANARLNEHFHALGRELDIMEPKLPEDIYKSHLEPTRMSTGTVDSARQNLASSYVNGLVNCGFGRDKLLMEDDNKMKWIYRNKDAGMMSSVATLGWLLLWDDDNIKAGALLACGVVNSGVRNECEPALALLADYVENKTSCLNKAALIGLGVAYAGRGSGGESAIAKLQPLITEQGKPEQAALAALSCGVIAAGTLHSDVTSSILQSLLEAPPGDRVKPLARLHALGLALCCLGRQEAAEPVLAGLAAVEEPVRSLARVLCEACAYACAAVLGVALVAMGEDVGKDMAFRIFGNLLRFGEANIKRAVPLALGLVYTSNPELKVLDLLSKFSHDSDLEVALSSILAMGLCGAGTNNARLAAMLRQLAGYHAKDPLALFAVRLAQGLTHLGKGTLTLTPSHSDKFLNNPGALAGLLAVLVAGLDMRRLLLASGWDCLLFYLTPAIQPRLLMTFDADLQPMQVPVRVGQAVDTVGQAGRPKTITGFQTHTTPVLLAYGERAELATEEYEPVSSLPLEGFVILRKNPNYQA